MRASAFTLLVCAIASPAAAQELVDYEVRPGDTCRGIARRVLGDADVYYAHLDVRTAIEEGLFDGPRITGAGHYLSITGGGGDLNSSRPSISWSPTGSSSTGWTRSGRRSPVCARPRPRRGPWRRGPGCDR